MNEVIFIRHGATAGNLQKRYIGRTDEPLCPEGVAQIEALAGRLPAPDELFVSPMLRTLQTAELLYPGMEFTVVEDLRETDFGIFEGKTASEMAEDPAYRAWVDSGCTAPIPGGEAVKAFKARCIAAFRSSMKTVPPGGSAAFAIHGGGIMAILEALALPKRDYYSYHIGNGVFLRCVYAAGSLRMEEGAVSQKK